MKKQIVSRTVAVAVAMAASFAFALDATAQMTGSTTIVLKNDLNMYTHTFEQGRPVTLHLQGDGDTDLDILVIDENEEVVVADTNDTDQATVTFTPAYTGEFVIVVYNYGPVYNEYELWVDYRGSNDNAQLRNTGGIVLADDSTVYEHTFRAGQPVTIRLAGDGDTDLDLFVFDDNDNLIAADTHPSDIGTVTFTPNRTATFTIIVENFGDVYNAYRLWIE